MQKRKGFTLVELVIVIAVIAILAGVLIGTFASVINRANDSARLQELKAQEIEQKADDILKKIEDSGWYGWEDFETSIVSKMTQVYKDSQQATAKDNLTEAQIKKAVTLAIEDYAKANANEKTSLTEDQVRAIVENAVGEISYSGVTEPQVKAIIDSAQGVVKSSDIPASTVREIVEAANANNLTAPDVTKIITINIGGASSSDFDAKLDAAVAAIKAGQRSDTDLTALIATVVPVTKHVATAAEFEAAVKNLQSGSTIYLDENFVEPTGENGLEFTLKEDTDPNTIDDIVKTFTLRGKNIAKLTVNAPKATLYVMNNVTTLDVVAIANNSIHTYGTVENATVKAGRYVVEQGSITGKLKAAPTKDQTVTVEVGAGTSVAELEAEYQTVVSDITSGINNYIQIVNAGRVASAKLTGVDGWNSEDNTTNLRLFLKAGSSGITTTTAGQPSNNQSISTALKGVEFTVVDEATDKTTQVSTTTGETPEYKDDKTVESFWGEMYATSFAGGDGSKDNPYQISNAAELARLSYLMLNAPGDYKGENYVLTANIDLTGKTWMPISSYSRNSGTESKWFAGTFDGNGYTINAISDNNVSELVFDGFLGSNASTVKDAKGEYCFGLFGSVNGAKIRNINLTDVNITSEKFTDENNNVYLADSVGGLIGTSKGSTSVFNVNVSGTISATDAIAGIIGRIYVDSNAVSIDSCTNNASIHGVKYIGANNKASNAAAAGIVRAYSPNGGSLTITNCVNNGNVTSDGTLVGGIAMLTSVYELTTSSGNIDHGKTTGFVSVSSGNYVIKAVD